MGQLLIMIGGFLYLGKWFPAPSVRSIACLAMSLFLLRIRAGGWRSLLTHDTGPRTNPPLQV